MLIKKTCASDATLSFHLVMYSYVFTCVYNQRFLENIYLVTKLEDI